MNLQIAIQKATDHLLSSDKARSYTVDGKSYVLELERDRSGDADWKNWIEVTTWGFDYEGFHIPTTRPELISLKCRSQLDSSPLSQILTRYCLDILRRETP